MVMKCRMSQTFVDRITEYLLDSGLGWALQRIVTLLPRIVTLDSPAVEPFSLNLPRQANGVITA